jgi:hypothetical protein
MNVKPPTPLHDQLGATIRNTALSTADACLKLTTDCDERIYRSFIRETTTYLMGLTLATLRLKQVTSKDNSMETTSRDVGLGVAFGTGAAELPFLIKIELLFPLCSAGDIIAYANGEFERLMVEPDDLHAFAKRGFGPPADTPAARSYWVFLTRLCRIPFILDSHAPPPLKTILAYDRLARAVVEKFVRHIKADISGVTGSSCLG